MDKPTKGPHAPDASVVKHHGPTPGPWTFSPYMQDADEIADIKKLGLEPTRKLTNEGQAIVMSDAGRIALVDCQTEHKRGKGYQTDCEERSANARLIAAAPDMLAVLQDLIVCADAECISGSSHEPIERAKAIIAKATGAAP